MSKPPLVRPDLIVRRIWDVPISWSAREGILYEVYDVDGTVGEISCLKATDEAYRHLNERMNHGFQLCFATNALRDLTRLDRTFNAPVVQPSTTRKGALGELLKRPKKPQREFYERVLDVLGNPPPHQVAMYGDKYLADICGAAQVGMRTILVSNMGADLPFEDFIRFRRRETRAMARQGVFRLPER